MKIKMLIAIICCVLMLGTVNAFADSNSQSYSQSGSSSDNEQGQGQNQSLGIADQGNIKDSFNTNAKSKPHFVIPGDVQYGYLVNHYAPAQKGFEFQTLRTLLLYANRFSEGALENILSKSEGMVHEMKIVNQDIPAVPTEEENGARYISVVIVGQRILKADLVGYVSTQAKSWKTTSVEVMAMAALDALRAGANVIQFTAEGAVLDTEATGWGIGFNATTATVSSSSKSSTVASGGTGYSSATAGLREKPWLQAFALRLPDDCGIEFAPAAKPAAEKK
jgi:hypothetical protein